jgi:hypothetical protein
MHLKARRELGQRARRMCVQFRTQPFENLVAGVRHRTTCDPGPTVDEGRRGVRRGSAMA